MRVIKEGGRKKNIEVYIYVTTAYGKRRTCVDAP